MPNFQNRIGIAFDVNGANQYQRSITRAAQANIAYGRSLPVRQMQGYLNELERVQQRSIQHGNDQKRLSASLIRTETQVKRSRLAFTQFRKELTPREVSQYSQEIGRLDHLLGGANRTLRTTNQRIADNKFNSSDLSRLRRAVSIYTGDLRNIRTTLRDAFSSDVANQYIKSLSSINQQLSNIQTTSRNLQQFPIPTLRTATGGVDIGRLQREFSFPEQPRQGRRQRLFQAGRRALSAIDDNILNPTSDAQGRIARNTRQLANINRVIRPLEDAANRASANVSIIRQGTRSALNDLEKQIEIATELHRRGDRNAITTVRQLTEERNLIIRNIEIRELEDQRAQQALIVGRSRTEEQRNRLDIQTRSLRQLGIQRTLLQNLVNLGSQFVKNLAAQPTRPDGIRQLIGGFFDPDRTTASGALRSRQLGAFRDLREEITRARFRVSPPRRTGESALQRLGGIPAVPDDLQLPDFSNIGFQIIPQDLRNDISEALNSIRSIGESAFNRVLQVGRRTFSTIEQRVLRVSNFIRNIRFGQGVTSGSSIFESLQRRASALVNTLRNFSPSQFLDGFRRSVPTFQQINVQGRQFVQNINRIVQQWRVTRTLLPSIRLGISQIGTSIQSISLANVLNQATQIRRRLSEVFSPGNLRGIPSAIAGFRDFGRNLQVAGGIFDVFRSAESQIEKIQNRLRDIGRDLAAPAERIEIAQARFNIIESETNARLEEIRVQLDQLDQSAKRAEEIREQIQEIRETQLRPIDLDISITRARANELLRPLQRELTALVSESNLNEVLFSGVRRFLNFDELREYRREYESILDNPSVNASLRSRIQAGLNEVNRILDPLERRVNQIQAHISRTNLALNRTIAPLEAQSLEYQTQLALLEKQAFVEETTDSRRVAALKDQQERLERRLSREQDGLRGQQLEFNVVRARADEERTILRLREQQLRTQLETGAGSDSVLGALGDTVRSIQDIREGNQITDLNAQLEMSANSTNRAHQEFAAFSQGLDNTGLQARELGSDLRDLQVNIGGESTSNNVGQRITEEASLVEEANEQLAQSSEGILSRFNSRLASSAESVTESIRDGVTNSISSIVGISQNAAFAIRGVFVSTGNIVINTFVRVADAIVSIPFRVLSSIPLIGGAFTGLHDVLRALASGVRDIIGSVLSNLFLVFQNFFARVLSGVHGILESVRNFAGEIVQGIQNTISNVISGGIGFFRGVGEGLINGVDRLRSIIEGVFDAIRGSARRLTGALVAPFHALRDAIQSVGETIQSFIINPFEAIGSILSAPIRGIGFVLNALSFNNFNAQEQGKSVGQEYHQGIGEGINNPVNRRQLGNLLPTIEASSPPKSGPFSQVGEWGQATGQEWSDRFSDTISKANVEPAARNIQANLNRSLSRPSTVPSQAIREVNTQIQQSRENFANAGKSSEDFSDRATTAIRAVSDVTRILQAGVTGLATSVATLRTSFSNLSLGAVGGLSLVIGGLLASLRAANFRGIITGFNQFGASLEGLREASARTVSDINLMRTANLALAGATETVRDALVENLPTILEIARAQAVRTGQSVEFLTESLLTGIKRASPRLIDNTGLVIRIGQAYDQMADSLGKSRQELTASETQLAILGETVRAGSASIQALGRDSEGAGQKMERLRSGIGNIADRLSFGLQPALEATLDGINSILLPLDEVAIDIASRLFVITNTTAKGIGRLLSDVGRTTATFFSRLANVVGINSTSILEGTQGVFEDIFFGLVDVFGSVAGAIAGIWETIEETVFSSLQRIGSWLIGTSPPPAGPLMNVDEGGTAVYEAWRDGFIGDGPGDIEDFADDIQNTLTQAFNFGVARPSQILQDTFAQARRRFGGLNVEQLEERIATLDRAVQPFETRLGVIREHFDAIQKSTETSLDAINRRIGTLLQSVAEGDEAAAAEVRRLDELFSRIQLATALDQRRLDTAAISIGLLKAQQAEERTLLEIELQRRREQEQAADAAERATTGRATSGRGGAGDGDSTGDDPFIPDPIQVDPLSPFLRPGTRVFAADALDRFLESFANARDSITGTGEETQAFLATDFQELDRDIARGFGAERQGNIIERIFEVFPDSVEDIPERVTTFFSTTLPNGIINAFNSAPFLVLERFLERFFGLESDFSLASYSLYQFFFTTLPFEIIKAIGATTQKLGIDEFIADLFGVTSFDADAFLLGLGSTILNLPSRIIQSWTDYVNDLNERQLTGDIATNIGDRLVQALFNVDFTLDPSSFFSTLFSYISGNEVNGESPENTLGGDIQRHWEEFTKTGLPDLTADIFGEDGVINATLNLTANVIGGASDAIGGAILSLLGISTGIDPNVSPDVAERKRAIRVPLLLQAANTLGDIFRDIGLRIDAALPYGLASTVAGLIVAPILGPLTLPLAIAFNVLTTPVDEITPEFLLGVILGIPDFSFEATFSSLDTWLTTELPKVVRESLRDRGPTQTPIISNINQFFSDITGNDEFNLETVFTNAYQSLTNLRRQIHEVIFGERLATDDRDISTNPITRGLIQQISEIPQAISNFLAENDNFLNLRDILRAALGDPNLTLQGIWDGFIAEVDLFVADPFAYIGGAFSRFGEGIQAWAEDPNNPIVAGINSLGTFLTGNPEFSVASVVNDIFKTFDAIAREVRIGLGIATVQDLVTSGLPASHAAEAVDNQLAGSILTVFVNGFNDLRQRIEDFLLNPANTGAFSLVDSVLQFVFGNEDLTLAGIVEGVNDEIDRIIEEGLLQFDETGISSVSPQTQVALDNLASLIFNADVSTTEIPAIISSWVLGLPERIITYFDSVHANPEVDFEIDEFLQAIFDDPNLTAASIIPNILTVIRQLPGAIADLLATTDLFGTTVPVFDSNPLALGLSAGLEGDANQVVTGFERQFSLIPFFERIVSGINDAASAFFNENPLGQGIINAIRFFTGDVDFNYDDAVIAFGEVISGEVTLGEQISQYLADNPNFLGIDSLVQFFTGDDEFTLAGLFSSGVADAESGALAARISATVQDIVDSITGVQRIIVPGAGIQVVQGENIFQRIGRSLADAARGIYDEALRLATEQEDNNFLGLDNLVSALSGGQYTNVAEWLRSWTGEGDAAAEELTTFPAILERITTGIGNLFSPQVEGVGETAQSPFRPLLDQFDPTIVGTLAWHFSSNDVTSIRGRFNQFGEFMITLFEVTIPNAIKVLEVTIKAIVDILLLLSDARLVDLGEFPEQERATRRTQEILEFLLPGTVNITEAQERLFGGRTFTEFFASGDFSIDPNDSTLQEALNRAGTSYAQFFELLRRRFFSSLSDAQLTGGLTGGLLEDGTFVPGLNQVGTGGIVSNLIGITPEQAAQDATEVFGAYRESGVAALDVGLSDGEVNALINTIMPAQSPPAEGPLSEIDAWGEGVGQTWVDAFAGVFNTFFGGAENEEGAATGWQGILNGAFNSTVAFATMLPTAFATLPNTMWDVFAKPLAQLFNYVIEQYNELIGSVNATNFVAASQLGIAPILLAQAPTLSIQRPEFLGAERGGVFGSGGLIVGERGPELIVPSQQIAVFPTQTTKGLSDIGTFLNSGQYVRPIYNTYNTYNYNTNDDNSTTVYVSGDRRSGSNVAMQLRANAVRRPLS